LEYWRSVGDGFHLTKRNILDFPVSKNIDNYVEQSLQKARRVWYSRRKHEKSKLNSGKILRSYDFTGALPSLIDELRQNEPYYNCEGTEK
jgi:hypothetical protein